LGWPFSSGGCGHVAAQEQAVDRVDEILAAQGLLLAMNGGWVHRAKAPLADVFLFFRAVLAAAGHS
jgi:hypothetical protein